MKPNLFLACASAVVALSGCSKNPAGGPSATTQDTVKITQASPPAGGTWADVVNETADGVMMGNPNAKVKLIEIGSLSCPHCKAFADKGVPSLVSNYVKTGQVSWEFQPYVIHGALDMANNLVARCNGIKTFFPFVEGMYKQQDQFLAKAEAVPKEQMEAVQNLPTNKVFVEMANLLGLQDWAAARGLSKERANQCLSDQKMIDREVQFVSNVASRYPDFPGTPTFIMNGKMVDKVADWEKLEPILKAAVK